MLYAVLDVVTVAQACTSSQEQRSSHYRRVIMMKMKMGVESRREVYVLSKRLFPPHITNYSIGAVGALLILRGTRGEVVMDPAGPATTRS